MKNRAAPPPSAPSAAAPSRRFAGLVALALFLPLTLITGCPFKADEYQRRCIVAMDCSDGNQCTEDLCTLGVCENPNKPKETACGAKGASVCDGEGACIECVANADCVANHPMKPVCDTAKHKCVSCNDGVKNGGEVDVDCGGPDCGACLGRPCDAEKGCGEGTFCTAGDNVCCSTVCAEKCEACVQIKTGQPDGMCSPIPYTMDPDMECIAQGGCGAAPGKCRCEDGVKNSDESDIDCGGTVCAHCTGGETCLAPSDCEMNVPACVDGACCSSECDAPCFVCSAGGQCQSAPPGYPEATCPANKACGPAGMTCVGKATAPCTTNTTCLSGVCLAGPKTCDKSAVGKPCNSDSDCVTGATCLSYICM